MIPFIDATPCSRATENTNDALMKICGCHHKRLKFEIIEVGVERDFNEKQTEQKMQNVQLIFTFKTPTTL